MFQLHGFCPKEKCAESHDVDDILDWEEAKIEKKRAKRRRRRDNQRDSAVNSSNEGLNSEMGSNDGKFVNCHRQNILQADHALLFRRREKIEKFVENS